MRGAALIAATLACASCRAAPSEPPKRVTLRRVSGASFELVPSAQQHPLCLAYTVSRKGVIRQLTMSARDQSFECPANEPIGGRAYRVPEGEGPVKVYVLFTSAPVSAASVSQQLLDAADHQHLTAMDLRLPGNATLDALEFEPLTDAGAP